MIAVETTPDAHTVDDLLPEERAHVARAVEKRQREHAAGRWAARQALARLGVAPTAILVGDDRAPRWPAGIAGSITHCAGFAAAAVAHVEQVCALGIDAEVVRDAPFEGWQRTLVDVERARLATADGTPEVRALFATFAAKEAFFKLQWPVTATFVDFTEAEVTLDLAGGRWTIRPLIALSVDAGRVEGRLAFAGPRVIATAWLSP